MLHWLILIAAAGLVLYRREFPIGQEPAGTLTAVWLLLLAGVIALARDGWPERGR